MIVVVTGYPRCGSSLMMRMLDVAGYPVYCEPESHGKGYEAVDIDFRACEGTAVKLLHPLMNTPPKGNYLFIHLTRDARNQAKSGIKFLKTLKEGSYDLDRAQRTIENYTFATRRLLATLGEVIELKFEDVLKGRIERVAGRLGLDAGLMRSVIVPRGPAVLPYMLEAHA